MFSFVRCLLTIICLHKETVVLVDYSKSICLSVNVSCIFHGSWCESIHDEMIFQSIIVLFLIVILAAAVWANHSLRTCIKVSAWNHPGLLELVHSLTDDAIEHIFIWPLMWCNKYKPCNLSTPLQWFLTFSFISQREREAMKDERTHHGAIDKQVLYNLGKLFRLFFC